MHEPFDENQNSSVRTNLVCKRSIYSHKNHAVKNYTATCLKYLNYSTSPQSRIAIFLDVFPLLEP